MKNNKVLIIIGIIFLNIVAAYMIGQSLMGKTTQYEQTLIDARGFFEQELCSRSIEKYNEAVMSKDTLEVRLEMLDVYEHGIDIGEFTKTYDIYASVTSMVDYYREIPLAYEEACEFFLKYNRYEECAQILMQARDLEVTSEKIEQYRSQIRYRYTLYYSMYEELLPLYNDAYRVKTGEVYSYLSAEASPISAGEYLVASSFSEGYAFVKKIHPDTAEERGFIIDKTGARHVYLDGVESSSGVGKAQDAEGKTIYLLSCKIGDRYKYYDINGKEMFGDYLFAGRFRNNVAAVMVEEGKWKLINGTGTPITDQVFADVILNEFDECAPKGWIFAKVGNQYHLYDWQANRIGSFTCDYAKAFVDDYAAFQKDGMWGYVDTQGNVIIEPHYADAKSFSYTMGGVQIDGSWQFINAKDELVIEESFEDVDFLSEKGICFVKKDGYWSYLKMFYTGR